MTPTELKTARQKLGLTQAQLAHVLGLSGKDAKRTVRRWEAGEIRTPGSVARLVRIYLDHPEVRPEGWPD